MSSNQHPKLFRVFKVPGFEGLGPRVQLRMPGLWELRVQGLEG